jgi:hypothetical protein
VQRLIRKESGDRSLFSEQLPGEKLPALERVRNYYGEDPAPNLVLHRNYGVLFPLIRLKERKVTLRYVARLREQKKQASGQICRDLFGGMHNGGALGYVNWRCRSDSGGVQPGVRGSSRSATQRMDA